MSPFVDQKALEDFIDHADLDEVRRAEAALTARAASVRLRVVELETQPPAASIRRPVHAG